MKFSQLTLLTLIYGTSAFVPSNVFKNGFAVQKTPQTLSQKFQDAPTILRMADFSNPGESPKKKTRKEQLIEELETKTQQAATRRRALEAELEAAEAERLKLLKEAERAAKLPDPVNFGAAGGSVPFLAGGIAAAIGARQALAGRGEKMEDLKREQQIAKAAAEQDAKNRAAAEARNQAAQSAVSLFYLFFDCCQG